MLVQFIYEDLSFHSPFLLTYIATSLLSLHIPLYQLHHAFVGAMQRTVEYHTLVRFGRRRRLRPKLSLLPTIEEEPENMEDSSSCSSSSSGSDHSGKEDDPVSMKRDDNPKQPSRTLLATIEPIPTVSPHRAAIKVALIIAPIWFAANALYNYSLLLTSASSSTVLSNLSASFTLAFSYAAGIEDLSLIKVIIYALLGI